MIPLRYLRLLVTKWRAMPVYLIHFVTKRCNSRCRHCFISDGDRSDASELSLDEIRNLVPQLGRDLYEVCLAGGEPCLREDIVEISRAYIEDSTAQVLFISTNGLLSDRYIRTIKEMARIGRRKRIVANISLDGIGGDHDRIRGVPGMFESAVRTFRGVQALARQHSNVILSVNITVSQANQDKVVEVYRFVTEVLGVRNVTCTLTRGGPREPRMADVNMARYQELASMMNARLRSQEVPGYGGYVMGCLVNAQSIICRRRVYRAATASKYPSRCYAGSLAGVIADDGRVYRCELIDEDVGNVREQDFRTLWHGERMRQQDAERRNCFCTHECFLLPSILFNIAYWPELVWEAGKMACARLASRVAAASGNGQRSGGGRSGS